MTHPAGPCAVVFLSLKLKIACLWHTAPRHSQGHKTGEEKDMHSLCNWTVNKGNTLTILQKIHKTLNIPWWDFDD